MKPQQATTVDFFGKLCYNIYIKLTKIKMPNPEKKQPQTPEKKLTAEQLKAKIARIREEFSQPYIIKTRLELIHNIPLTLSEIMLKITDQATRVMLKKTLADFALRWLLDKHPKQNPSKADQAKIDKVSREIDQLSRDME